MCKCKNITFGTKECHGQQVELTMPGHMQEYAFARENAELSNVVYIDPCIVQEILDLWALGIVTYGSCCGHNLEEPYVNVHDKDIDYMIRMGYEMNHPDKTRRDTFRLTSYPWPDKQ